jgi:hypothetical protein
LSGSGYLASRWLVYTYYWHKIIGKSSRIEGQYFTRVQLRKMTLYNTLKVDELPFTHAATVYRGNANIDNPTISNLSADRLPYLFVASHTMLSTSMVFMSGIINMYIHTKLIITTQSLQRKCSTRILLYTILSLFHLFDLSTTVGSLLYHSSIFLLDLFFFFLNIVLTPQCPSFTLE